MIRTLTDWLNHCEHLHPSVIDMGLERVQIVWQRMACPLPTSTLVFTVGGTNGKGSTCTYLEQTLLHAGYRVGLYTSPHLLNFTERIAIQGMPVKEATACQGFAAVEAARLDGEPISLSYFEFITLVALHCYAHANLDAVILEVGLGGRLDAVNIIDADCSIITSIDIDHQAYLGNTREAIGFEKAHIYRPHRPAICADPQPPDSLLNYAEQIQADLWLMGRDFNYSGDRQQWSWAGRGARRGALAYPALRGANQLLNASGAIAALHAVRDRLPVTASSVRQGLMYARLAGRFQIIPGQPAVVLDVAHNPHAASVLAQNLDAMGYHPTTHAVFAALADKSIDEIINAIKSRIDVWHVVPLSGVRSVSVVNLVKHLQAQGIAFNAINSYESVAAGYDAALAACKTNEHQQTDRVIVFGSFMTVAAVMQHKKITTP
ncbi:MAG: FolC bifunctional protein [Pseudomonadota bacterium]|jgi:dihydrofolate synthase/folylpolyglutamate synthase